MWKLLLILSVTTFNNVSSELPSFRCEMEDDFCVFWSLNVTETDYRFYPRAPRPNLVTRVRFFHNELPVFGPDICNAFPNTQIIEVYYSRTKQVTENAFNNCKNLTTIDFRYHNVDQLLPKTFRFNKNLRFIRFDNGNLNFLPSGVFQNQPNLTILSISNNKLNVFPADLLSNSPNLTELWIYSNEIADLNENALIRVLPKLKKIYFNDNDLRCDRVLAMVKTFEEKGIEGFSYVMSLRRRPNIKQLSTVRGVECLSTDQWNAMNDEKGGRLPIDSGVLINLIKTNLTQLLTHDQMDTVCSAYCKCPE